MSATDRQNRLLVAEDWKRIYQSYRNANFISYDFDNLRRTMINYLRQNYPEDFNDYIESSEYLALVDLIAYLGQNLAFRIDLNARENYLELAERRESVLRLARLINYNPKRNTCANGLLKIASIKTDEDVFDSNNINLQNQTIVWNDPSNPNWYEQFIKVLNRAFISSNTFGSPTKNATINGVPTEQYKFNIASSEIPIYSFTKNIDGQTIRFEIVSTDLSNSIIETAPKAGNRFSIIYRNDGQGAGSSNSGFFSHFRQGTLDQGTFTINSPSTTQVVSIDATNINNDDVWLYKVDSENLDSELWTKVSATKGNNVIYNSLAKNTRNIYSVLTRANDRVSLIFPDGVFGNLPKGAFRVYYRTSKNQNLVITPNDLVGISISFSYITRTGKTATINLNYELQYTVQNSSLSETNLSIKQNAPAAFYTQNRLITAEDYQIGPLTVSQDIIKVKSVNRTASGISRYFDLLDATGKYSATNIYGTDGIIFKESFNTKQLFTFNTRTDIEGIIENVIQPIISKEAVKNFYFENSPTIPYTDLQISWEKITEKTNYSSGYFINSINIIQTLGSYTTSILSLVKLGANIKFSAPVGMYFDNNGLLQSGDANSFGSTTTKWSKVQSVYLAGNTITEDNNGPVVLNNIIPTGAVLSEIRPFISNILNDDVRTQIIDQIFSYKTFGLRWDRDLGQWLLILEDNLNVISNFSIGKAGDNTSQKLDASWLLKFTTDGQKYTIEYRSLKYFFESDKEVKFFYDKADKAYDSITSKIIKDKITILNINTKPQSIYNFTQDYDWSITDEYRDPKGYVNSKKIELAFFDSDDDGVYDDPELFNSIVEPTVNSNEKLVFFQKVTSIDGVEDYVYKDNANLKILVKSSRADIGPLSAYSNKQIFYVILEGIFLIYDKTKGTLDLTTDYKAAVGRDKLKFHYVHGVSNSSRIDPSSFCIIDCYILTFNYDKNFRQWLNGTLATKPLPLSSDQLYNSYSSKINEIKSLTDEIIYHPAKYKMLFGETADVNLQATFKIVKNPEIVINDNDLKTLVIEYINEFFALDNWDFGETFYFTELTAYVMKKITPNVVTFLIVPNQADQTFGSLYEIKSEVDEIFISSATVNDVEIIDAITANNIQASGLVITSTTYSNTGIQSTSL